MLASVRFSTKRVLELNSRVCRGKQCYLSLTTLPNAFKWWCPPGLHLRLGAKMSTIKWICVVYMTLSAESLSIKSQPHSRVLATCTRPTYFVTTTFNKTSNKEHLYNPAWPAPKNILQTPPHTPTCPTHLLMAKEGHRWRIKRIHCWMGRGETENQETKNSADLCWADRDWRTKSRNSTAIQQDSKSPVIGCWWCSLTLQKAQRILQKQAVLLAMNVHKRSSLECMLCSLHSLCRQSWAITIVSGRWELL